MNYKEYLFIYLLLAIPLAQNIGKRQRFPPEGFGGDEGGRIGNRRTYFKTKI